MKKFIVCCLLLILFLPTSAKVNAQGVSFGVRTGLYSDASSAFIGAELIFPLSMSIYANPNLEYVFLENANYMTINLDAHYDFPAGNLTYLWAGAGLGIIYINPDGPTDANTNLGLNLLLGLGFRTQAEIIPYIQLKGTLSENNEFSIGLGLRF